MKLTIQLPDELCDKLDPHRRVGETLNDFLVRLIAQHQDAPPGQRYLLLRAPEIDRIIELTGRLPLTNADELVQRIAALAELSIGGIRFQWTPHQYRQLKDRAERHRLTVEEYSKQVVREIEEQFFSMHPR